ncbi:tRNA uridine-5-carboxymethylaminomethyl(34) synthesis GTPase MnmE [Desulfoluna spongiiphila]|uniref:tRNA modification GTPase MnmE n=1 Tax=Desulfoluna spongiiphila TaxID=419481 RepID=A0A1G5J7D8_9BACT|nr:tRNA uridine-5-carboxymethylaminomethyl(34) synthesis GTPase MnmE [Desulfoluna spongiiphila]SCY83719.1 tRNA modification GTPase trmE [Desulfoluna spongiiphila]VVS92973.1 trna modification gtpase mnme [Desulfoluna spongiiphila]
MSYLDFDTIAAIATPVGRGGIGIIRVSGQQAVSIAMTFFRSASGVTRPKSHRVYYGTFEDGKGVPLDEVILFYMKGPKSYTAEDCVEIQSHASPVVMRQILDLLIEAGARLAEPGEFTKRAYLNGRINLSQAEAVIDLINARTTTSHEMAISMVKGELGETIAGLRESLKQITVTLEAILDFPDDVDEEIQAETIRGQLAATVAPSLVALIENFDQSDIFRHGIRVVIAGPPNSGKSSLLNRLSGQDRAIVTNVPGTTRDLIDEFIHIDGIAFQVTDTAGIRTTDDPVEKIGIERTLSRIEASDLVLYLVDGSHDVEGEVLSQIRDYVGSRQCLVLVNKADLSPGGAADALKTEGIEHLVVSVKTGEGMDAVKEAVVARILARLPEDRSALVPNRRQVALVRKALNNVENAVEGIDSHLSFDAISIDIRSAMDLMGEILGEEVPVDILDEIFSNFCIGK